MKPEQNLEGRVAIVTGGAGGIGCASARELCARGAAVVVSDIDEARGEQIARELVTDGARARFRRTDVSSHADVAELVADTEREFGRIDIMFNNAGIPAGAALLDWSPERYRQVVAVNQDGVFHGIQAAARAMCAAGRGGVIINTGSVFGDLAARGTIGYQATKAAVEVMTRVAALELAEHGIRVVNLAPGIVDTPMIEAYRRLGQVETMASKHLRRALIRPDDVARVVAFLASDDAACINGTTVFADDGYSVFK